MDKKTYKKELNLDRKTHPYEPENEAEARELAEYALKYNYDNPDEILSTNYLIRQFLQEKYGNKFRAEEREEEIAKEFKEKESLKRAVGLEDERNIDKLKSSIQSEEYAEAMRVKLGLKEKYNKDSVKEQVRKRASEIKEDEIAEKEADEWWEREGKQKVEEFKNSEEYKKLLKDLKEN